MSQPAILRRAFLFTSALGFLLARGIAAESGPALAQSVHAILEAKCVECHGADLPRPDGKFGYVLDLARVAGNPEMIVRGDPQRSELYLMVFHDEMPGEDASVPPLTPEEKETVRRWIEIGAPALADAPSPTPVPLRHFTTGQRLVRALGQFHPPSSHFPIALLIAALPAEAMWKMTRKASWKATVRFCVTLGAASAVLTAALGWCGAAYSNYTGVSAPILFWHRWVGTGTAVWAVFTACLSEYAHKEGHPRRWRYVFRVVLLAGIILVSIAGYLGASLIYGIDHFKW